MIWRLDITLGVIRWLGPCHTYTLWPRYTKRERENW